MLKIAFIINSAHKTSSLNEEIITACKTNTAFSVQVKKTQYAKHAFDLAAELTTEKVDCIIAVGGDGTIHEILNGILSQQNHKPKIGILPNGTGNDFMRTREHFQSTQQFIQSLLSHKSETIDIGQITSKTSIHYFINIADIGFGGAAIHTLNKQRKLFRGKLAYSLAILKTFFTYKKSYLTITSSNYHKQSNTFMVVFCNGSIFGSGLTIHPKAKVNDGQMHVVVIGNVSLFDYLRYLPKLKKGEFIEHSEVEYLDTNKISVDSKSTQWTEADGEIIGSENIQVELLPHFLQLLIP